MRPTFGNLGHWTILVFLFTQKNCAAPKHLINDFLNQKHWPSIRILTLPAHLFLLRTSTSSNLYLSFKMWQLISSSKIFFSLENITCDNVLRKSPAKNKRFFFCGTLSTPSCLFLGFLVKRQTLFTVLLEGRRIHESLFSVKLTT